MANIAPVLEVEDRKIVAVEHPMMIQNIDKGIKTFGNNRPFLRVMDSDDPEECVPLYLAYNNPMCTPILSHHTITNNVLLKITVPKRTGRKRKRGSQEPFQGGISAPQANTSAVTDTPDDQLRSHSRMDSPKVILRKLKDNSKNYKVEAIGELKTTHRYRGLSDFHHSVEHTEFFPKFRDNVLPGNIDAIRNFKFDRSMGWKPNEEFLPGPVMTNLPLPFNWAWQQNSNIFAEVDDETGKEILVNRSKPKGTNLVYLPHDVERIPTGPPHDIGDDPQLQRLVKRIEEAMEERPLWTRRSLINHVADFPSLHLFKPAIQFVGYQFRGGPFRDAIIKYGVDPRTDQKYRKYQTFFFKLYQEEEKVIGTQWHDVRTSYNVTSKRKKEGGHDSHLFNGRSVTLDGKVWQCCDITDPLLARLINDSPYAPYDAADGYFQNGTIAKIKAIMKTKLLAIRTQKELLDTDFERSLAIPDFVPDKLSQNVQVPLPDVRLTNQELETLRAQGNLKIIHSNGVQKSRLKGKKRSQRIRDKLMPGTEPIPRPNRRNKGVPASYIREKSTPVVGVFEEPNREVDSSQRDSMLPETERIDDVNFDSDGNEIDMETSEDGLSILNDDTDDDDVDSGSDIEGREMRD